jgi:uncharacterized protein YegL
MLIRTKHRLLAVLLILILSGLVYGQSEKKVAYGILIDNTGSMRSQFDQVTKLGKAIARHAVQQGPVSVFNFTSDGNGRLAVVNSGGEWSQNGPDLENLIDDLFVLGGQTTLLDSIDTIAKVVNTKVNLDKEAFSNGVVVLITDGEDRVSRIKEAELIKELQKSGIKVFAIGLTRELDSERGIVMNSKRGKAEDLLKKITKETGGRAIFPNSKGMDAEKLVNELLAVP